jgi:hypothetical protein
MVQTFIKQHLAMKRPENSVSASLSFHLTAAEKKGIASSLDNTANKKTFRIIDSVCSVVK